MNTQTHLLVGAALFARPGRSRVSAAALFGAALPDLSLFLMVGWESLVNGRTARQIFDEDYFSTFWRAVFAVDNSIPLYALLLALGAALGPPWLLAFAGAAFLHVSSDLLVHHDDGRPHFEPFTDWIFQSPVSYWDPAHHGGLVGLAETVLALALAVLLWRRFGGLGARAAIIGAVVLQLATGATWARLAASM